MKSIHELIPLEENGRHARNGFNYQDHVGVSFCLEMLIRDDIEEIWFETHDDITLIWKEVSGTRVEFVQVKAHNPISRWSVAAITNRDNGQGSSLVEKSLSQHRCSEMATFRVVTSYDITDELALLKNPINSPIRVEKTEDLKKITQKIQVRLNGETISSESGKDINYWVNHCLWDKRSDRIDDLENSNKLLLEKVFKLKKKNVIVEHRDELYTKLLSLIRDASSKDLAIHPDCYKISRLQAEKWFEIQISQLNSYSLSDNPLKDKMQEAEIPNHIIELAQSVRWRYIEARLNPDYYGGSNSLRILEDEVMSLLPRLQLEQYTQGEAFNSLSFFHYCIGELYKLVEKERIKELSVQDFLAIGFFYQVTSRCLMRFTVNN